MQNGALRQKTKSSIGSAAFAAAVATCVLAALSAPALAQSKKAKAPEQAQPALAAPGSPLIAVVSIGRQRVTFYDRNGAIAQAPISSGQSGHDTPQGVFSIIEKKEEHNSNLYNDASMPFMQRITWSGVAMHAGPLPGYAASHGCIRLPYGFAERIFKATKLNTRVVVMQGEVAPMSIAHANLFQPRLQEIDEPAAVSEVNPDKRPGPSFRPSEAESGPETPMMLGAKLPRPAVVEATDTTARPQRAVISLMEAARAKKLAAAEKAVLTTKASDSAKLVHRASIAEVGKLSRTIGPTDYAQKRAETKAKQAERTITFAKTEELVEKARAAHALALEEATVAAKTAADAKFAFANAKKAVAISLKASKDAEKARIAAAVEAKVAERLTDPISVFVSRKAGRLYIRQGRIAVMDVPITIKDPQKPIGTHVFTAMESTDGGRGVNWNVVNVDAAGVMQTPQPPSKGKNQQPARPTVTAAMVGAAALDRIEFPEVALARITPYLQPGSSLIVSDLGLSVETGQGTDFVVLTRGEAEAIDFQRRWAEEHRNNR